MVLNIFKTSKLNKMREFIENGGLKPTLQGLLSRIFTKNKIY